MQVAEQKHQTVLTLIDQWEPKLKNLPTELLENRYNVQHRTIKQILGHMIDSASNNTHRIIHLQYQESPLTFPDYASHGTNDKWIDIQNYQTEDWQDLLALWVYANKHFIHVARAVNPDKLTNEWISGYGTKVTLNEMILDFLPHFELHLAEIDELIKD